MSIIRGLICMALIVGSGVAIGFIPNPETWQIALIVAAVILTALYMIACDVKRDAS